MGGDILRPLVQDREFQFLSQFDMELAGLALYQEHNWCWFCCRDAGDMKHNQRDDAKSEELHRHKIFGRNLPSVKFKFLICDLLIRIVDEISAGVNFLGFSLL